MISEDIYDGLNHISSVENPTMEEKFTPRANRLLKKKKKKKAADTSSGGPVLDKTTCTDYPGCKCCVDGEDIETICYESILRCPLLPKSDFSILLIIIQVIAYFLIGIPLVLLIVDKLFCG